MTRNPKANVYISAIAEPPHWVSWGILGGVALATGGWVPLLLGSIGTAAYLLFYADSDNYRRVLLKREDDIERAQADGEKKAIRDRILKSLDSDQTHRYRRLTGMRDSISADAPPDDIFYGDIIAKLNELLDKFLIFAEREAKYRSHLESVRDELREQDDNKVTKRRVQAEPIEGLRQMTPSDDVERWAKETVEEITSRYDKDASEAEKDIAQRKVGDPNIEIIKKRIDIIRRRANFIQRIGQTMVSLNHQMSLLDDTFGLIADETRAMLPQEMLTDIEDVVMQTNAMTETLDAIDGTFSYIAEPTQTQQINGA